MKKIAFTVGLLAAAPLFADTVFSTGNLVVSMEGFLRTNRRRYAGTGLHRIVRVRRLAAGLSPQTS